MKIAIIAAIALAALASPATAQECTKLDAALTQMKGMVPDSSITISDDVGFIAAYHKALGINIPDESQPVKFLMVVYPPVALIGIVEPDGCIKHYARIPLERHLSALSEAAGV